jgi:hypothetical protein
MTIERTEGIRFHERGTLEAVTRWISSHNDGIAEWFKNVRRQYQIDRANVAESHRVAVLLLRDAKEGKSARIGVLDVGGATLEDVTEGSTWQDPEASGRGSGIAEEETQGNGGKAYMYRLFVGPTRILGVSNRRRNCKGFDGESGSVERGTPGWIPNLAGGREVEISSFDAELRAALEPYGIDFQDLPPSMRRALSERQAFTLVEGKEPVNLYKGRIDVEDLVAKVARHDQSTLCLEQVDFYVLHNGRMLNEGKRLALPPITPYPGLDTPFTYEIPDHLPLLEGHQVSTTDGGQREQGRLTLHTSAENMWAAWRNLRPRWQVMYRTRHQMIGTKPISEVSGNTPGAQFIYGTVELPALEPAYVETGRRRPKPGPLVEALDRFIAEKIKEVATKISERRREDLDDRALDEVHDENRKLDEFKNRFLPSYGEGGGGAGAGGQGPHSGPTPEPPPKPETGAVPEEIEYFIPESGIHIGAGVTVPLQWLLSANVLDATGRLVRAAIEWTSNDKNVAAISKDGQLEAKEKGTCEIQGRVRGTAIQTKPIGLQVWNVDHVLLTPRTVDLRLGTRQEIIAEVTGDDGKRSTDVLLDWNHDAEDQLLVRINRRGVVIGNRLGRTAVSAGAGAVWSRIPVEVNVIPNPDQRRRGSGFPRLLLTGRDIDPATGSIREGDPDQPALWQEVTDFNNNVWWLNLQSPEAAFAFRQRSENVQLWRAFHAEKVIEMVVQVWMGEEFTRKGESQRPDYWASHQAAMDRHRVRIVQEMWKRLEPYVTSARGRIEDAVV